MCWGWLSTDLKIFWSLLLYGAITDLISSHLSNQGINNLWLIDSYVIVEYSLIIMTLSCWESKRWSGIYRVSIPIVIGIYLLLWVISGQKGSFNSIGQLLECILIVFAALITIYHQIIPSNTTLWKNYKMWILLGILFYFGFTSFVFVLWKIHRIGLLPNLWVLHSIVNIISNVLFGISFLWVRAKT